MAVKEIIYKKNLVANTERGPSEVIWGDCPWAQIQENPVYGYTFWDDFNVIGNAVMTSIYTGSFGQWSIYAGAGVLPSDAQLEGGVLGMLPSVSAKQMVLQSTTGGFRFQSANSTTAPGYSQKMWYEARVSRSTITTAHNQAFVGLMSPGLSSGLPVVNQPISGTDTLSTVISLFGFSFFSATADAPGPTDLAVAFGNAAGTVNYPTNLATLANTGLGAVLTANQYIKIGFIFDQGAQYANITSASARQTAGALRRKLIRVFINGVELPGFLSADDLANATTGQLFPTSFMCPVLASSAGASVAATDGLYVDWIRVAQLSNS